MKISHKYMFIISVILASFSWLIAIRYWGDLPSIIPIHFDINGQADGWAEKTVFYVFMMPILQVLILGMMMFFYEKPQYSNFPTTMWLMAIDEKHREKAFDMIRTMIAATSLWIGVLFTYLTFSMNVSAMNGSSLSVWFMLFIIGTMLAWLVYWSVRVYGVTRKAISAIK